MKFTEDELKLIKMVNKGIIDSVSTKDGIKVYKIKGYKFEQDDQIIAEQEGHEIKWRSDLKEYIK